MNPITVSDEKTQFVPVCYKCQKSIERIGVAGKTHEEIDSAFRVECEKRGIELAVSHPPIGGVIRKLAEWKEERL